jgi:transcriptional regulator with XRE-family HTH domain
MTNKALLASTRKKKYKVPNATEELGQRLKIKRLELKYSLSDAGDLTDFSTSTIVDIENGVTVDINYYIAYAQSMYFNLPELFDLKIEYGPLNKLSAKKIDRAFLTDKVKNLYTQNDFFINGQTVQSVASELLQLNLIPEITSFIRTRISGILSSLVKNNFLYIEKIEGRKHVYKKLEKQPLSK